LEKDVDSFFDTAPARELVTTTLAMPLSVRIK
jgi:hypothetical protein